MSSTKRDVQLHIDTMCALMRVVNESNIPKRDQEMVTVWFEALCNVDTPKRLDTLHELLKVHHD